MTAKKKKLIALAVTAFVLLLLTVWVIWANTALESNTYTITSEKIPAAFEGYRIAHISDLHNTEIGKGNEILLSILEDSDADIIAITGDMIDSRNTDVDIALRFAEKAVKIAPCYYVTGNHESRVPEYPELEEGLINLGVTVLKNDRCELTVFDDTITILGVDDPTFNSDPDLKGDANVIGSKLKELCEQDDDFTLLLSHRPELFDVYVDNGVDLVLSGHAHGGQFRLPFIGGAVAPHQGFFPKYYEGMYTKDATSMIVSRGIGNSIIPIRFNNRPEVILIELRTEE